MLSVDNKRENFINLHGSSFVGMEESRPRNDVLPAGLAPRGLSRVEASRYIGIGTTKFDELVGAGRMPRPRVIGARKVWDRIELDAAFADLPHEGEDERARDDVWAKVAL